MMTQPRAAAALRTIGIGVLGLIGGVLFAIVVQDVLSDAVIRSDGTPSVLGIILGGTMLPVFGLLGAALAVGVSRRRSARSKRPADD